MKVLKIIRNIILGTLCFVFFVFAICVAMLLLNYNKYGVTEIDNKNLILIKNEISSDKYKKGDLVIVEGRKIDQISSGDEIFMYQVSKDGIVTIDVGIVESINTEDNSINYENGSNYSIKYIVGSAIKVYNDIGTYLSIIESKWGFLFAILVPCFFIFIYQVYALIVEIKYGNEDEEEETPKKEKKTKKSKKNRKETDEPKEIKEELESKKEDKEQAINNEQDQ